MEKTRVPKGEKYWSVIYTSRDGFVAFDYFDTDDDDDIKDFERCNYFHTKEEAEAMARKLRAVLKGVDVIEMPSEDNMLGAIPIIDDPYDYVGCGRRLGWRECYSWLKSKIVK